MGEKVSIIVPVYNVQDFIANCLDSLIRQDYNPLEIILVDDGSTDGSLKICEDFADKDSRIKIVHQENAGAGAARNCGIDCATGDYITFVDGDDYIENNYVSALVEQKKKFSSDIAATFNKEFDEKNYYVLLDPAPGDKKYDGVYSPSEWLRTFFPTQNSEYNCPWMKLYDRKLFKNIRYPEHHSIIEDAFTTWRLILSANRISFENILTYNYRKSRSGSLTDKEGSNGYHYANIKILNEKIAIMNQAGLETSYMFSYYRKCIKLLYNTALNNGDYETINATAFKVQMINKYCNRKKYNL